MEEYRIKCIVHDENKVITHVGIGSKKFIVQQIVDWINNKKYKFYTLENGTRAEVKARKNQQTGRWFLISTPDGIHENNLDYLPYC